MFLDSDVYIQAVFDFSLLEAECVEIVFINISGKLLLFFCLRNFFIPYVKHADEKVCVIYWLHLQDFKSFSYQLLTVNNGSSHYSLRC